MIDKLQKVWREGGFIVGVVLVFLAWNDMKATAGEAKEIMEQQVEINAKLTKLIGDNQDEIRAANTRLEVYLKVYGFDDDIARAWSQMPRDVPTDSAGMVIPWEPWLEVDSLVPPKWGVRYMVDDSGHVLTDTLWIADDE